MSTLKRNLIANYVGNAWTAIVTIAFIPTFIKYLGMEAYGLIGLFAVMQTWLTLFDMGMTPALNREMARFSVGSHSAQSIRNLLRSLEVICLSIALILICVAYSTSGYVASDWLNTEQLSPELVARSFAIMGVVLALHFCESIYRSSLIGLQCQVWFNIVNTTSSTFRFLGAVVVLARVSPTIDAFFIWQGIVSFITLIVFALSVHLTIPKAPKPAQFSRRALTEIWSFIKGMAVITCLSLLLTQVDKLILSRLLHLQEFGYYTMAATIAGGLYMIIAPITQAVYPVMVEYVTSKNTKALVKTYHQSAQLVVVLIAPAALLLSVFSHGIIYTWSGDIKLAAEVAPLLSLLVIGTLLNGLIYIPYQTQLAHGWTSLTVKVNLIGVVILVPAILFIVPKYGAMGAALIWVILNTGYVLIGIQFMHRKILCREKWHWYVFDVLLPCCGCVPIILIAFKFRPSTYDSKALWLFFLTTTGLISIFTATMTANEIRPRVTRVFNQFITKLKFVIALNSEK